MGSNKEAVDEKPPKTKVKSKGNGEKQVPSPEESEVQVRIEQPHDDVKRKRESGAATSRRKLSSSTSLHKKEKLSKKEREPDRPEQPVVKRSSTSRSNSKTKRQKSETSTSSTSSSTKTPPGKSRRKKKKRRSDSSGSIEAQQPRLPRIVNSNNNNRGEDSESNTEADSPEIIHRTPPNSSLERNLRHSQPGSFYVPGNGVNNVEAFEDSDNQSSDAGRWNDEDSPSPGIGGETPLELQARLVDEEMAVVPAILFEEDNRDAIDEKAARVMSNQRICLVLLAILAAGVGVGVIVAAVGGGGGDSGPSVAPPTTAQPTVSPTQSPTIAPTRMPTVAPTQAPKALLDFGAGFPCSASPNGFVLNNPNAGVGFRQLVEGGNDDLCVLSITRESRQNSASAFASLHLNENVAAFRMVAQYRIYGPVGVGDEGMAFVMHQDVRGATAVGDGEGYFNDLGLTQGIRRSLAVFLRQERGVDTVGVAMSGSVLRGASTTVRTDEDIGWLWVEYCPNTMSLQVFQNDGDGGEGATTKINRGSIEFDPKSLWNLTSPVYVGFTAGNDNFWDTNEIYGVSFVEGPFPGCRAQ